MIERQIKLNETEDVQEFVKEAAKCSFDITRELTVRCYGESQRFNAVMDKFAIA